MANNQQACSQVDLSSVRHIFTGAAPLGAETAADLHKIYPSWKIRQGYGKYTVIFIILLTNLYQDSLKLALSYVPVQRLIFGLDPVDLFYQVSKQRSCLRKGLKLRNTILQEN